MKIAAIGLVLLGTACLAACNGSQSGTGEREAARQAEIEANVSALRNAKQVSNDLPRVDAPTNRNEPAPK